jgi:hypothetical protein
MSHDTTNADLQKVCSKLVDREIIYCVSSLIDSIRQCPDILIDSGYDEESDLWPLLQKEQFTHEYEYECGCGHSWTIDDDEPQNLIEYADIDTAQECANCHECGEAVEPSDITASESDPCEVFEHWIVSSWLAEKLKEHGQPVGELLGLTIWGRMTTGQSISIDSVIVEIASAMEILPGQRNEWEV